MSGINPQISNGTCYYAAGKEASSRFLPCGNDATGRKTCCGAGDNCLSSRACYNNEFGVTYLAGCSDPSYRDETCPDKGQLADLPWTGLVYCNGTSEEWTACNQEAKPSTLTKGDFCFCPETSRAIAFKEKSILTNIASLPTAAGSSIKFEAGHAPPPVTVTAPPAASSSPISSPASSPPSSPSSNPITATGPGSATSSSSDAQGGDGGNTGLSVGAKAGIGAGVAAAGLLALAIAAFFYIRRRKHAATAPGVDGGSDTAAHNKNNSNNDGGFASGFEGKAVGYGTADQGSGHNHRNHHSSMMSTSAGGATPSMMTTASMTPTPVTPALSELDSRAARPWSMRSELQGSDTIASAWESQHQNQHQQWQPYRPPADSTLIPAPLVPGGGRSGEGTGVGGGGGGGPGPKPSPHKPGALSPVHELP